MSLKKIAALTGCSVSTVSRVLNDPAHHCQDRALSDKIHKVARELNYIPNASARNLKMGTEFHLTATELDVLLARFNSLADDAFFGEVFSYLEAECMKHQCKLVRTLNIPDIVQMEKSKERPLSKGIIVLGKCPADMVSTLHRKYKGVVAIDRNPTEYKLDEVVCDGAKAADLVVEYLYELGHRKIAYVGDCSMEARYTGYYECLLRHKISLTYEYVVSTGQTHSEGYAAYKKLAEASNPPTAVFCANDATALGFLQAMKDISGRRRKNVYRPAVASIDDIAAAANFSPMLTTVHIPKEDLVHIAVTTLLDRLQGGHSEYLRIELPCHLIIRESSGVHVL